MEFHESTGRFHGVFGVFKKNFRVVLVRVSWFQECVKSFQKFSRYQDRFMGFHDDIFEEFKVVSETFQESYGMIEGVLRDFSIFFKGYYYRDFQPGAVSSLNGFQSVFERFRGFRNWKVLGAFQGDSGVS